MDELKRQIKRKLLASIIADKCKTADHILFNEAWCTQERVIRFTSSFFRELLGTVPDKGGNWNTGDLVMYEAVNGVDSLTVKCVFCYSYILYERRDAPNALMLACGVNNSDRSQPIVIKQWNLSPSSDDVNKEIDAFVYLIDREIPRFEQALKERINEISWPTKMK